MNHFSQISEFFKSLFCTPEMYLKTYDDADEVWKYMKNLEKILLNLWMPSR